MCKISVCSEAACHRRVTSRDVSGSCYDNVGQIPMADETAGKSPGKSGTEPQVRH